ncbi:MOSC domain-containing protein [Candidatus Aalborgicola defluviihabitans]|uniref:MOSC domain-containing protein n=1 Tax=Candidatus Aalborgicola defluviihabitans TaxID=3386187 RepID=UPI001DFE50A8|nr:MOSC N-terminal beta barrel domain-containing protein [Burkholderiales bacterium]
MSTTPTPTQPHIARLFIYPIKSCAGIELPQARLTETGLLHDRWFMLVDAQGRFVSQRELARMALIRPEIEGAQLRVRAPGMADLVLPFDAPADEAATVLPVQLWAHNMPALDVGAQAAAWFSRFLGQAGLRLVRFDPTHRRASDTQWTGDETALNLFSDGFPLLVLSQAALDGLNRRLLAQGLPAAQLQRFRPNIVIDGVPEHEEDLVAELLLLPDAGGDGETIRLRMVKPCPRCPIPNIDPSTAHSTPHVIDCLGTYRQDARVNGAVSFGMNAIILAGLGTTLRVGQPLELDYGFE